MTPKPLDHFLCLGKHAVQSAKKELWVKFRLLPEGKLSWLYMFQGLAVTCLGWHPLNCIWCQLVLQTQSMWITSSVSLGPDCGILPCLAPSWLVLYLSQDLRKYEAHGVFATLGPWKILWGDPYTFALDVPGNVSGTKLWRGDLGSLPSLGLQRGNKA